MGHLDNYISITPGEEYFHGPFYHMGHWNTTLYPCCRLCKTRKSEGKYSHWAKGLCRSCYRRLSITHRLYNDTWNKFNLLVGERRPPTGKKEYKQYASLDFDDDDIDTLLDRYNWRCAYSKIPLQGHDHRKANAFQLEYHIKDDKVHLVPICRKFNCSKKGLEDEFKLQVWARKNELLYPFVFITPEEYYESLIKEANIDSKLIEQKLSI